MSDLSLIMQLHCACQLFTSNLVTRSASAENADDADRSVADVEQTRVGATAERHMFDPSESMLHVFQSHLPKIYTIKRYITFAHYRYFCSKSQKRGYLINSISHCY